MSSEREVLWRLMANHLFSSAPLSPSSVLDHIFSGELAFPEQIERGVIDYLEKGDLDAFNLLALSVVKSFYLSGYVPEGHVLTTAYLLRSGALTLREACRLVQVDASNYSLMSEEAKDLVWLCETLDEEESLGVNSIDGDDVLSTALEAYFNTWAEGEGSNQRA